MAGSREAILEAADRLFGEVGFDAASTRLIGEASGVNKALIHYHFRDKRDLWNAVLDRYYERLRGVVEGALVEAGTLRERLVRVLGIYLDFLAEHRSFARMVQREVSGGRHIERITAHMLPLFASGAGILAATYPGTGSGDLSAAHLLVSFYGMAVTWVTYAPVIEGVTGVDPLSVAGLLERKRHLSRMVGLVMDVLERGAAEPAPRMEQ